jgi:hypothetical protein
MVGDWQRGIAPHLSERPFRIQPGSSFLKFPPVTPAAVMHLKRKPGYWIARGQAT